MKLVANGKFQVGNTIAKGKTGKKHKVTIIREKLGLENIEDLKIDVLNTWYDILHSNDRNERGFAVKELSKYLFVRSKEIAEKPFTIADFIKEVTETR